jgi:hypothetical protein
MRFSESVKSESPANESWCHTGPPEMMHVRLRSWPPGSAYFALFIGL